MSGRGLLLALWLLVPSALAADLVVVMDDLGYSLERAERVLALPGPVTLGLLPFAPDTAAIAARARATGHEIILHQPMEPLTATAPPAPGTLTLAMTAERFTAEMDAALSAVPGIIGINNHNGSRLTQHEGAMRRVMAHLAGRGLMFLDSRTTPATVAYAMALEARVPAAQRDVFLDHVLEPEAMAAEFQRALTIARRQGHAVIIAHPHRATLAFLEVALAGLAEEFSLVSLGSLVSRERPATLVRHENPASPHRSLGQ